MDPNDNPPTPPAPPAPGPAAGDPPSPAPAAPEPSLLAGVKDKTPAEGENPTPPDTEGVPEKFHVKRDDGTLDEAATLAKLAKSYRDLEAHKGAISKAPEKPEDYVIELKDADGKVIEQDYMDDFKADPLFQQFTKDAHAQGFSNDQMNFIVGRYMNMAPQLIAADQAVTRDEASKELSAIWKDESTFNDNLVGANSAITAYGGEAEDVAGSRKRLEEKFGNDPDFLAFAAKIGAEMKEDRPAAAGEVASEVEIESLQKSPEYWDAKHPNHKATVAKVTEFYTRKHGVKAR